MDDFRLGEQEMKFAELIWQHAPINSTELVKLSADAMKWKKSTTYTMLRRLCERGIFKNDDATVSVLVSRDELIARQSLHFVEDTFGGSLPKFLAAFFGGKGLTDSQADELVDTINKHKGAESNG